MAWAEMCGTDPETMRNNPHLGLEPAQSAALGHIEDLGALGDDDRNFVFSQLLALVARVLSSATAATGAVDDDPASPTYARYVIDVDGTYYDPGQAVVDFMDAPPGRDLAHASPAARPPLPDRERADRALDVAVVGAVAAVDRVACQYHLPLRLSQCEDSAG